MAAQFPASTKWCRHVFLTPYPVHLPPPPRFIPRCLLVSSEVLIYDWRHFAFCREARELPFPSDHSPRLHTPRYSAVPLLFRLPPPPPPLSLSLPYIPLDTICTRLKSGASSTRSPVYARLELSWSGLPGSLHRGPNDLKLVLPCYNLFPEKNKKQHIRGIIWHTRFKH